MREARWTVYGAYGTKRHFQTKKEAEKYAKGTNRVIIKTRRRSDKKMKKKAKKTTKKLSRDVTSTTRALWAETNKMMPKGYKV